MKNKILYERSLRTCIIMLVVCIVFKLFGAEWFDLNTSIPILQKLDNLISNNLILSFVFTLVFKMINSILVLSIINKNMIEVSKHFKIIILFNILSMISYHFINSLISFIIDIVFISIVGKIILNSNTKEISLTILINIIYQMISLFVRNIGLGFRYYGFIENQLLCLDYYVLLLITYLYLNKGGYTLCGEIHHYFSFLVTKLWKKRSKDYLKNKGDN